MSPTNSSNRKTIKLSVFIFGLFLLCLHQVSGQSTPAAIRQSQEEVSSVEVPSIERQPSQSFRKQLRSKSKVKKLQRTPIKKKRKKGRFSEYLGYVLFYLGVLVMIFGAISVAWFGTFGAAIFLIALGIQILGLVMVVFGFTMAAGGWDFTGVAALIAGIMAAFAWAAWGIIGLLVWLIP